MVAVQEDMSNFLSRTQTVQLEPARARAAAIIERPSTAANGAPFCDKVMRRVARAIDGAAPNRPAKLLGRKASPNAANADTAMPPARKRKPYSSIRFLP